jgi:hypothetical protein
MRNLLAAVVAASALFVAAGTGCAPSSYKTTKLSSVGDQGTLTFRFDSSCILDCSLDQPALQGSAVSVAVKGGTAAQGLSVRLADSVAATISQQSSSCNGSECTVHVEIETKLEGDAKLEVVDRSGTVVDGVALHVKAAARIDVAVRGRQPGADGVYTVKQGEKLKVESTVFDNDRTELFFASHGVSQVYGDKTVVGPDDAVILGSTDVEDAIANNVGETTLTLRAVGAESVVRFRVTK